MAILQFNASSGVFEDISTTPYKCSLSQNYPNPFNPSTVIKYSLDRKELVSLKILNVNGQIVRTVVDEFKIPGNYSINLKSDNLSSGIYYYQLKVGNKIIDTKSMVLVK